MIKARIIKSDPIPPPPDEVELVMDKDTAIALRKLTGDITYRHLDDQTVLEPMHSIFWALNKIVPQNGCKNVLKPVFIR